MTVHFLGLEHIHREWDNALAPALEIDPGDSVVFDCLDAGDGRITPSSTVADLAKPRRGGHPLTGPVFVRGAEPGDVLVVEIIDFQHRGWGWSSFGPRGGLLPEDFPEPYLHIWHLEGGKAQLKPGVQVYLQPFAGIMGVAPAEPGPHATMPPRQVGGNMDIRQLTPGATLYLPVAVPGALFSVGDCHAAQGDGEVCITGIEAPMLATFRFNVKKGQNLPGPQFQYRHPLVTHLEAYATTGVGPDLMQCAKEAVRHMIAYLVAEHGLTREEAYLLCSVAVDLRISEVVDAPHWIVSAHLPLDVFRTF